MAVESHAEWTRRIGAHCPVCGRPVTSGCAVCAALPCRADTTDPVAPDAPCAGYRSAVTRELTRKESGDELARPAP
jgi:hypothetical protein